MLQCNGFCVSLPVHSDHYNLITDCFQTQVWWLSPSLVHEIHPSLSRELGFRWRSRTKCNRKSWIKVTVCLRKTLLDCFICILVDCIISNELTPNCQISTCWRRLFRLKIKTFLKYLYFRIKVWGFWRRFPHKLSRRQSQPPTVFSGLHSKHFQTTLSTQNWLKNMCGALTLEESSEWKTYNIPVSLKC